MMVALYERFRPQSLDEFVGFSEVVSRIEAIRETVGLAGQVYWITGASGWGKTTLARILAKDVSTELDTEEIDAQDLKLETLDTWARRCHYYPQHESYAFLVNEAHTLLPRTVSKLQTFLEEPHVQRNGTFFFTTTDRGHQHLFDTRMDAFPFLSRAIMLDLELDPVTCLQMVDRLKHITAAIGLPVRSDEEYHNMVAVSQGNLRQCIQAIASNKRFEKCA
jgi:replication-associated recombination protein RarA